MKSILTFCALALLFLLLPIKGQAQVVEYVHTDALGSPVAITNEAGQVIERTDYEPYGNAIGKANNDRPGYTGHVMDSATGLTYMQQRYYDPTIGRLLSTDPVGANINFNRYSYANNNPYRFTDPDGRMACEWCKNAWVSVTQFLGIQAADAGAERSRYSQQASKLDPNDSAGRSQLKAESRARTPSIPRAAVEASRPSTAARPGTGGRANVSNSGWNNAGGVLKWGGRAAVVVTVAQQVNEIAHSPEPARDVAGAGGLTLGAIGGGEGGASAGAFIGSFFGPGPGTLIGAGIGGLVGSAVGGHYGEKGGEALYDKAKKVE